jgi:cytidylate kinase
MHVCNARRLPGEQSGIASVRFALVPVSGDCLTPSAQAPSLAEVTCRVVCISHATGSGGEEVGRLVAERLDFLYVDDDIVARAAASGGISHADVADEERRKSFVSRFLEALAHGTSEVGGSVVVQGLDNDDVRALIRETIERTAARGNAVIVAHAASHVVEPGDEALRVLVTASPSTRADRLVAAEALEPAKAARTVKDSDAGRRDYLKRFYEIDEELPTQYDLVVNTDVLSVEQAADLVSRAASSV